MVIRLGHLSHGFLPSCIAIPFSIWKVIPIARVSSGSISAKKASGVCSSNRLSNPNAAIIPMRRKKTCWVLYIAVGAWACLSPHPHLRADAFLLHDGDTVAFLGDSITAARGYTKIIEHYTLMRFPERKIKFYNAGKGGAT